MVSPAMVAQQHLLQGVITAMTEAGDALRCWLLPMPGAARCKSMSRPALISTLL